MKDLIRQFGRLRLLALALTFLPLAAIPLAGVVWLWQTGYIVHWLLFLALCGGLALLLQWWLVRQDRRHILEARTRPDGNWSATAEGAWEKVEALAQSVEPNAFSLSEGTALWSLGRTTLEQVATHFFPDKERPLLEMTLPHALLIVERASGELRKEIIHTLPFSHRFSLGSVIQARRWQRTAARYENVYRLGRALFSPAGAVYREFSRAVGGHILDYGSERLQRWLLQEYVRKVGFYAIELYSGNLLLSGGITSSGHPLRVLVVGPAQSGKTRLIETFSGKASDRGGSPEVDEDAEPVSSKSDRWVNVHRVRSTEWGELEFWEPAAWNTLPRRRARRSVAAADMIIWTSHVMEADEAYDVEQLARLKRWLGERVGQPEAPLLVALTYGEATKTANRKKHLADQSGLPRENIVGLSTLGAGREEAQEALRAAFAMHYSQAVRCQYWRYLNRQRRMENRELAGRQLRNSAGNAWKTARGVFRRTPKS